MNIDPEPDPDPTGERPAQPVPAGDEPLPPPGWPVLPPEAAARFAEHLRQQRRP